MPEQLCATASPLWEGYVSDQVPGTGGRIRIELADFCVEEIPLYEPAGEGQHTLFEIEKRGISTMEAMGQIARELGVHRRMISSAGLKDAHAITRQRLSVEGVAPEAVRQVERDKVRVLWAERHRNRLKIGHLKGNRFAIRIREVAPESVTLAEQTLGILIERGIPNGFGEQRFGIRGTTHVLGKAMLRGDLGAFWHTMLGSPQAGDDELTAQARGLFDAGDLQRAAEQWPDKRNQEYQYLLQLAQGQSQQTVFRHVSRALRRLYVAAYQSCLYNQLMAQRLAHLGTLELGDLAVKHENGAYFAVTDPEVEQPRADRLEISPSAPLYGYKVRLAEGRQGERERELITSEGVAPEDWRVGGGIRLKGQRRPLRIPLIGASVTWDEGLLLKFELPKGAYATNVLREIIK